MMRRAGPAGANPAGAGLAAARVAGAGLRRGAAPLFPLLILLLAFDMVPGAARAQQPAVAGAAASGPALVPPGHWSLAALDRLHGLGLVPAGTHRGERRRTVGEVARALAAAADSGSAVPESWRELAAGYLARFREEYPAGVHAEASGGVGSLSGDVIPGSYRTWGEENWTGAVPRADRTTGAGSGAVSVQLGDWLAAGAAASGGPAGSRLDEAHLSMRAGRVGVWVGRRLAGYGAGSGGVVLSGTAPVDGAGVFLPEPVRLPGPLRYLGPVRLDVLLGVLDRNGPVRRPWFLVTHGTIEPHPRFGVGVTRAAMVGPREGDFGVTDLLSVLVGGQPNGSEYDNQVVSVDGWYRPPLGRLPLVLFLDWGAEDSAGAWWDVPGIVAGLEMAAVPALPWLSLRLERASFEASRNGNPPWYRHPIGFHEGWTAGDELLGHPLGGHGREWQVLAQGSMNEGRLRVSARGWLRERGRENVYAPERQGESRGAAALVEMQLRRGVELRLGGSYESGERDWRRSEAAGTVRIYLPGGSE